MPIAKVLVGLGCLPDLSSLGAKATEQQKHKVASAQRKDSD